MLEQIEFVMPAVAKNSAYPSGKFLGISGNYVTAFNGVITMGARMEMDLNVMVDAQPFYAAVAKCDGPVSIVNSKDKLVISSGKFKAAIKVGDAKMSSHPIPTGRHTAIEARGLIAALKTVIPFICDDPNHPNFQGVLVKNQSLYATNNICIIQQWLGYDLPEMMLPTITVKTLVGIGREPESIRVETGAITFCWDDNRYWLRTTFLENKLPDMDRMLNRTFHPEPYPKDFFKRIDGLKPFTDEFDQVWLEPGKASTSPYENEGAEIAEELVKHSGRFSINVLNLIAKVGTTFDFAPWPAPCAFFGNGCRGLFMGKAETRPDETA